MVFERITLQRRINFAELPAGRYSYDVGNLWEARNRLLAASFARFLGGAFVSSAFKRFPETAAISSTAARNAASLAFEGLLKPLTFLTNCRAAARISSSVTGGSKLKRVLMFLHTGITSIFHSQRADETRRTADCTNSQLLASSLISLKISGLFFIGNQ